MKMFRIPSARINWPTSLFLIGTLALSLTAVPLYVWRYGLDWFQVVLFLVFIFCSGLSITLGYHRLFAHLAFRASWPVRAATLVFGAACFEGSALEWVSDHRRHHKHVDHEDDPYDITRGFFHAHVGWLLFKLKPAPPMENVGDLASDRLLDWQHRYCVPLGVGAGLVLPALIGWAWGGARAGLGALLLDRLRSPLDLFHQLLLSHDWPAAIFEPVHGARQLDHGALDVWRGLPQLPP